MLRYRVYPVEDGHVVNPPVIVMAETDHEAVERAKQLVDGLDIEVWDGRRFIGSIKSPDPK
jgi:hypothetical protein